MTTERPRRSWHTALLLGLAVAFMAAVTMLPIGWQLNRFVVWIYYDGLKLYATPFRGVSLETLAAFLNVILTVPLGLFAKLALPRVPWWVIGLGVLVLSAGIELAQWQLPLGREGTVSDVVTNTIGGALGAVLGALALRWAPGCTH